MKKVLKKMVALAVSVTVFASGLYLKKDVEISAATDVEAWKDGAVISPTEGKLAGAGYIDIKIDTSLEGAKSYAVYFDGENSCTLVDGTAAVMNFDASKDTQKCEVYSVAVKKAHTAYVVAKMSNGSEVTSDTRTFYISKKGVAMGGDMSETVVMKKMNVSWYYNWAAEAFNSSVDEGVAHVPMVWGGSQGNIRDIKKITDDSNYILGFNEPDIDSQANMSAGKSLAIWPYVAATGKRTVSPALAVYTGGYMDDFLVNGATYDPVVEPIEEETETNSEGEVVTSAEEQETVVLDGGYYASVNVDAVALHRYGGSKTGLLPDVSRLTSAIDYLWDKYHKPIWVTEVSITGRKNTFSDWSYEVPNALPLMKEYVANIITAMDADDRVERYAWFPYNVESANEIDGLDGCGTSALFDYESGKFTELGVMYSEMGNPEGYQAEVIGADEKFVWKETTTGSEETSGNESTTKGTNVVTKKEVSTSKKNEVAKPGNVVVKAKNKAKKSVVLSWGRVKNAKGYEIQYSLSKKFSKAKKFKTKKTSTKKLGIVIKKLQKKKTYYFKVRAVNGKLFGAWSKPKRVMIKK